MTIVSSAQNHELKSRREAAEYLGVAEQTLAVWACTGRYPLPMVKIGRRVKYRKSDLDRFIERHLVGVEPMKKAA